MSLTPAQQREVFDILDRIDEGKAVPQVPGHVGRFLRQYARAGTELEPVLVAHGVRRREDSAVSGRPLGPITVRQLFAPTVRFHGLRLGEVAESIAVCEELGGPVQMAMWVKGATASETLATLHEHGAVTLEGDFRWSPPARITPGEARIAPAAQLDWQGARALKAVADDLARPPHALEYLRDHRPGQSGLKFLRTVCATRDEGAWAALPALGRASALRLASAAARMKDVSPRAGLALLLICREPWSDAWTIIDGTEITPDVALAHAITWADFQRELHGLPLDGNLIAGVRHALQVAGLRPGGLGEPNVSRSLLPVARGVLRHVRGLGAITAPGA